MSGEFCTACGARARTTAAPAAPVAPVAPAARKTSPIVWILVAILGLFILFGIGVVGTVLFGVHKLHQAGLDPELMRTNPGLATAKLLAATNPDLEVVSTDEGTGRITIRQKSTGKTMTVSFDQLKQGKITFQEDGKQVTMEAHGSGDTGSFQMKSGSETVTMGANQATMPAWIPAYPNSKPQSNFSMNSKEGAVASFQLHTQDALKDVLAFYERGLKDNGFKIEVTSTSEAGGTSSGLVSATDAANKRTVMVTAKAEAQGTAVNVNYSQK